MVTGLTEIEEEVILLKAIKDIIDSMVNFEMLSLSGSDPDSQIAFKTAIHQRIFNIILVDFLSRTDKKAPLKQTSYLGALKFIVKKPSFSMNNSVQPLYDATYKFVDWLEKEIEVDVWLPSVDTQTLLNVSRVSFLKMCGDISKHNFLRSVGVAEDLQKILITSGVTIDIDDAMLALSDFYERFHVDLFNYHSSTIAEFLNNIRWGVYNYLQPEFRRSIVWESQEPPKYRYSYPNGLISKLAKTCYWGLMNEIRRPPYVRKFTVTQLLKLRY